MLISGGGASAVKRDGTFMDDFLRMGGYAAYVWPAYAVSLVAIGGLVIAVWARGRKLRGKLRDLEDRRPDADIGAP